MPRIGIQAVKGTITLALPLIALAFVAEFFLPAALARLATLYLIYVTAVVGMQIYSGNSGIISFGHAGFMAVGAYGASLLTIQPAVMSTSLPDLPVWLAGIAGGQPLLVGMLGALLVVGVVAALFGLPLSRLGGAAASIATLGFLVIIHVTLVASADITRGTQTFFGVPRGVSTLTALPVALIAVAVARIYRDTRGGLSLRAAREDEIAARASGVNVVRQRFLAWVLGGLVSGAAGVLLAHFLGAFSPKDFHFNLTFLLMAMLILGGISTVSGAVGGTALIVVMVDLLRRLEGGAEVFGLQLPQVFGLTDIGVGLVILAVMYRLRDGLFGLREVDERLFPEPVVKATPPAQSGASDNVSLAIEGVGCRFAGLVALDDVSFAVRPGLVTGLIGPNGAGKSTLINAISGVVPPSSGRVLLNGTDTALVPVHEVPTRGLGRTFQNIRLFRNLTVLENVIVAADAVAGPGEDSRAAAMAALAVVGMQDLASRPATSLPYGAQRRLEIARALALRPSFLLLDEPAAGMNPAETDALISVLRQIQAAHRIGLLVVEHDLKLIMRLCDRIVVLNKGQMIAEGTPEEIRANPAVIEAYIGKRRAAA
ncbi:amino acid/amide ABC transporter membrane protein 2, HAAT family /amino acid/amide ABC transporter ATP-binding protein 1, HAAT family [Ruegeria intermedia]|uniref:Amino acid/amide ABC transporter membrane protein 2, HAAT family /amino acid/amide ABC transporter ATP-binding protein 1, HAAT family n=1 Tax=Ruegeria intermedia TaxID=996115 RepID=A0A1M4ZAV0_9RHOB|nr:branched-chain amino acid ABC transporter ATP-binding protein/permease [Ruegeria intermedia]SHF15161.1 amino acid/amide ABC transporter membrane protein 2, HAAT family /amino acid/amide ABC transporter ATP-binding protein 1, HAAT family [Ruegeria intermedia]